MSAFVKHLLIAVAGVGIMLIGFHFPAMSKTEMVFHVKLRFPPFLDSNNWTVGGTFKQDGRRFSYTGPGIEELDLFPGVQRCYAIDLRHEGKRSEGENSQSFECATMSVKGDIFELELISLRRDEVGKSGSRPVLLGDDLQIRHLISLKKGKQNCETKILKSHVRKISIISNEFNSPKIAEGPTKLIEATCTQNELN